MMFFTMMKNAEKMFVTTVIFAQLSSLTLSDSVIEFY